MTPQGRVKVLDFGLAKPVVGQDVGEASTASHPTLTQAGAVVGTLPYMAPQQLRGEPADARSDVWALGVMRGRWPPGRRPFKGQTGFEVSSAILKERPAPLPAAVPPEVGGVIERCLEKEPERRFQRASELQAALRVGAERGTAARRTAWGRRLADGGAAPRPAWRCGCPGGPRRARSWEVCSRRLLGRSWDPRAGRDQARRAAVRRTSPGTPLQEYFSDGLTEEMTRSSAASIRVAWG